MPTALRSPAHVLVMAKAPVPGRVKTRLCPPCTAADAAALAEAALADTLSAVARCGADRRIVALDGRPGDWLPPGFDVIRQRGESFEERLVHAWDDAGGHGLQIGMDTPQLTPDLLDDGLVRLDTSAAALGYAADGGWWAIGLRRFTPSVFRDVPMSTPHTGNAQRARLRALGFDVAVLPTLVDLDTVDDLPAVVAAGRGTRTAALARHLGLVPERRAA